MARADTVLVLPLFNESTTQNIDWIGESIAETIRESLSAQGVLVLSREDRMEAYRRLSIRANAVLTHASVIKLGEALDASQIIYGHFEISPASQQGAAHEGSAAPNGPGVAVSPRDSLHVSVRVLDLKHTHQGPEFEEIGALEDLASLETNLAWRCLKFLVPRTAITDQNFRRDRPALRLDAVENYIRGLMASSPEQKHRLFTQAGPAGRAFLGAQLPVGKDGVG